MMQQNMQVMPQIISLNIPQQLTQTMQQSAVINTQQNPQEIMPQNTVIQQDTVQQGITQDLVTAFQDALNTLQVQVQSTGVLNEIPVTGNPNFLRYFLRAKGNVPEAQEMVLNYVVCFLVHITKQIITIFFITYLNKYLSLLKFHIYFCYFRNGRRKAI
jgi:hypothetical protein